MQQRKHGEGQLQRQHHLAQCKQIGHAALAPQSNDQNGRQDRQRAGNEPPNPRLDSPMHEAFHHHLSGERAGDGAALAAGEQGDREQRARDECSQQRREGQIGDPNPIAVGVEMDYLSA